MTAQKRAKSKSKPFDAARLFELEPSKSQLQQVRIIEAAIASFAKHGLEKTTYTSIATTCKISRPLIHHYFPTLEDLFALAAKYVRQTLLQCALDEMQKAPPSSDAQLRAYLKGCFQWVRDFRDQNSFWLLYFYQASLRGPARDENTALVTAGHERIERFIREGASAGLWRSKDSRADAKMIQVAITGSLVSCMTEDGYLTVKVAETLLIRNVFEGILGVSID